MSRPSPSLPSLAEEMLINTEESVMANFDFLAREDADIEDEDEPMADDSDDGFSPSQVHRTVQCSAVQCSAAQCNAKRWRPMFLSPLFIP